MCQAAGQGYSRERDKHKHPDVELTNIKLSKHSLLRELTGMHCAGAVLWSRRRKQGGNGRRPGQEGSQCRVQTLS